MNLRMGRRGAVKAVLVVAGLAAVLTMWQGFCEFKTGKTAVTADIEVTASQEQKSEFSTPKDSAAAPCEPVPCAPTPCAPTPCAPAPCEPVPCGAVPCDSGSCPVCDACVCRETDCKPVPCVDSGRKPAGTDVSTSPGGLPSRLPGEGGAFESFPRRKVSESELKRKESGGFKSRFAEKEAVKGVTLTLENVCVGGRSGGLNGGVMLLYGLSEDEVAKGVQRAGYPKRFWDKSFNCKGKKGACFSHTVAAESPDKYRWVEGTTGFVLGQQINTFHNMADATWPFFLGQLNTSNSMRPSEDTLDHVWLGYLEEMETRGESVSYTSLWQLRMAMLASPRADLLELGTPKTSEPVCFERLRVAAHMCCRFEPSISAVGEQNHFAALRRYRQLTLDYLGGPTPTLRKLGQQLRVTFYGRSDSRRRRIANHLEVLDTLYNFKWWLYKPGFQLSLMDGLFMNAAGPPSFREQIFQSVNTDIFVASHGAGLWASLFLPEGSALTEIHGPCMSTKNTWITTFASAVPFTHDRTNPTHKGTVGSGRTTDCGTGHESGDYNVDVEKLQEVVNKFITAWPSRLPDYKPP